MKSQVKFTFKDPGKRNAQKRDKNISNLFYFNKTLIRYPF